MRDRTRISLAIALCALVLPATFAAGRGDAQGSLGYFVRGLDTDRAVAYTDDDPALGAPLAVAWTYRDGAETDVAVSTADALGQLAEPVRFGELDGRDQLAPSIVADPNGTLYLAFLERDSRRVSLAVRPAGDDRWYGPQAVTPVDVRAGRPALRIVSDRLVLAYEVDRRIEMVDYPLLPAPGSEPAVGTHGIQEGPDVVDPLGRVVEGDRSGEDGGSESEDPWQGEGTPSDESTTPDVRTLRPASTGTSG